MTNSWTKRFLIGTLCTLSLTVACNKSVSDDSLANDIKAKLYSDDTTKPASINVAVKDGVVTLSGDVASSDIALEAMKVANGTAGVKSVADQLTVNGQTAQNQLPNAGNAQAPMPAAATPPAPAGGPYGSNPAGSAAPSSSANPYGAPSSATVESNAPPVRREPVAPREPAAPSELTIPAGQQVSVRTIDGIDSGVNQAGQEFRGSLTAPLMSEGRVAIPAGSDVTLTLSQATNSGRFVGRGELMVRLAAIRDHGRSYPVTSDVYTQNGGSRGKQTAVRTGIGAAAGAVIGAIAGGGKGAAIGSLAGGGAGAGSDFFTHGPRVKIPSESVLTFSLEAPLTVRAPR